MTFTGHIHDGKVVLDAPAPLPDGTPVRVELTAVVPTAHQPAPAGKTLAERYASIIGAAVDLPPDMAENHDHYIHGTPKR